MLDSRNSSGCGCGEIAELSGPLTLEAAIESALSQVSPSDETEVVPLGEACGRTAADDIHATGAMPRFDNSAMDGFALRCADLQGGHCLPIAGTIAAGDAPRALPKGTALRIFTGAPLPARADAVVMVERCAVSGSKVQFATQPAPGDNIRRRGSDQAAGQMLVPSGAQLAPHHIGLLAANGINRIAAARKPRVAVFSTGDEISDGTCAPGQIPDANRPLLLALVRQAGAEATDLGILPDEPKATADAFAATSERYDLIVTSGAVSMGGKDHIRDALIAAGGDVNGWRVALKPGKPVMFGRLGGTAFTGLPGNPFAVHVGFHLFVAPQIARLLGARPARFATVPACAGFNWARKPGRAEVFPVRLATYDKNGLPVLERLGCSVSATLLPLSEADGLAVVPAGTDQVSTGDRLSWHPFCRTGE
ncbi:molybdopterin molybdotransferase MoeA [Leisingera caerulea]|uniref:molybdopterin molybdotransferase MoeA n=1 Tax=Leisingera caerulea TaxID=506591 RepID=UPI0021A6B5DA|nr:gephyrin-like molybdotransferase Glp [Leisingera caerulea]UWQ86008.1 molybdopterin molybdotransferase MoeA [Leisingera caerulea]